MKSPYSVHPCVAYIQNILANFNENRTDSRRVGRVREEGRTENRSGTAPVLKETHQLGTNYAWWIAERCEGKGMEDGDRRRIWRWHPDMWTRCSRGKRHL